MYNKRYERSDKLFALDGELQIIIVNVTKGFAKGLLATAVLFAGGWSVRDGNAFDVMNVEHYPNIEGNPGWKKQTVFM